MSVDNQEIRDRIAQNDVTVGRSYLEVDVMEWLSDNEIPYGYEAFVIPSVVESNNLDWQRMIRAIQALGERDQETYANNSEGTPLEDRDAFSALALWNDIYDKHQLQEEVVTVPLQESLSNFDKSMVLPDFALYPDVDMQVAPNGFDYSQYSYLVEVAGIYGVGLPEESTRADWWDWYRVSAVAFKEFIYRLLDLWDSTYWVLPNSEEIPPPLRDDDHFIIINPVAEDVGLDPLADELGITQERIAGGLSNSIELFEYQRPDENELPSEFEITEWEYDSIDMEAAVGIDDVVPIDDEYIVFHGEIGEVYLSDDGVQFRESQWQNTNMVLMREYAVDVLSQLDADGVVNGLQRVE